MNSASGLSSDISFLLRQKQRSTTITGAMPRSCQGGGARSPPATRNAAAIRLWGLVFIIQLARYYRAMLLASALARFIGIGRLSVIDGGGERHVFEGSPGPAATIRLHDSSLHWKLLLRPRLSVPEAYMDG